MSCENWEYPTYILPSAATTSSPHIGFGSSDQRSLANDPSRFRPSESLHQSAKDKQLTGLRVMPEQPERNAF